MFTYMFIYLFRPLLVLIQQLTWHVSWNYKLTTSKSKLSIFSSKYVLLRKCSAIYSITYARNLIPSLLSSPSIQLTIKSWQFYLLILSRLPTYFNTIISDPILQDTMFFLVCIKILTELISSHLVLVSSKLFQSAPRKCMCINLLCICTNFLYISTIYLCIVYIYTQW